MPPSPLLSARSVIITYFMVVCRVNVHIMQDKTPKTISGVIAALGPVPLNMVVKIAFKVYKGEVPISPKTIPKLIKTPPAVSALECLLLDTFL